MPRVAVVAAQVGPGWRSLLGETTGALGDSGWKARLLWDSRHRPPSASPGGHPVELRNRLRTGRRVAVSRARLAALLRAGGPARSVAAAGPRPNHRRSEWIEATALAWRPDLIHAVPAALCGRRRLLGSAPCPLVVSVGCAELIETPDPADWQDLWERVRGFHFSSRSSQDRARELGLPDSVPRVVGTAAPAALLGDKAPRRRTDWPLRVLAVGALNWAGGFEHAVGAVAELADRQIPVELRVVGAGPHADAVAFTAASLDVERRVAMLGDVAGSRLRDELAQADAVLDPSLAGGGSPVVEAARAMGVPVVMTEDREGGRPPGADPRRDIAERLAAIDTRRRRGGPAVDAGPVPVGSVRELAATLAGLYRAVLKGRA